MPPKVKFTRDEVVSAALMLAEENGLAAVTARALGERLGSTAKPIFGLFENMEEIKSEVKRSAWELYKSYSEHGMKSGKYPKYKASGMAYIRFAAEKKELFKMLFMCDRSKEQINERPFENEPVIDIIIENTGLCREDAERFHLEMWVTVHGIASMTATSFLELDEEKVSSVLTDAYMGHLYCFGLTDKDKRK